MALLPRPRTPNAQLGHRRAHSSALEICLTTNDDKQELEDAQPLLNDKALLVPTPKPQPRLAIFVVAWAFSIALAIASTFLWTKAHTERSRNGSFAYGFATELRTPMTLNVISCADYVSS